MSQQVQNVGAAALDPEVHRVARDELGLFHLVQDVELKARVDVGEEEILGRTKLVRNLGAEMREYAEVCLEGFSRIEIVPVAAAPTERLPFGPLESAVVYPALFLRFQLLYWLFIPFLPASSHLFSFALLFLQSFLRSSVFVFPLS